MTNLSGTASLLLLCLPGLLFSQLILGRNRWAENLALCFPIGVQIYTLLIFILNYIFRIQLSQLSGWIILIVLSIFLYIIGPSRLLSPLPKFRNIPTSRLIVLATILALFILTFFTAHLLPITDWDSVTLYDFRAKVILRSGWISDTLFRARFTDYPLLTTLTHWWMRVNGSSTPLPQYPLFLWTFAAAMFTALKKMMSTRAAFLAAIFILLSPKLVEQSFVSYSNLPYTTYMILGLTYLYIWSEKGTKANLFMGLLLTAMSLWARTFPFALGSIIALILIKKSLFKPFLLLVAVGFALFLNKIWPINTQLLLHSLDFLKWAIINYYFPYPSLFVLAGIYVFANKIRSLYLLISVTCYWLMIITGNYYYALTDPNFTAIPDAAQRTIMFINPAIALLAVTVLHKKESALN